VSWLSTRIAGSEQYARSRTAFLLFLLGVLNSFTNYGHHTYHLPQAELVKGIAFFISMTEAVILVKVMWDCAGLGRKWESRGRFPVVHALLIATTAWTCVQLAIAIPYSVPFLNTYVHGTLAIVAHSMGSLIGIDTMALLAAGTWLVWENGEPAEVVRSGVRGVVVLNLALATFFAGLFSVGVMSGIRMVNTGVLPWAGEFPHWLGPLVLGAGVVMTSAITILAHRMLRYPGPVRR
jgi:nitric oxide reductase subunit B